MNKYLLRINDKNLEVKLIKREGSLLSFETGGQSYQVEVSPLIQLQQQSAVVSATTATTPKAAAKVSTKPGTLCAPMPGIIVNILVKEGDQVQSGQKLLVIEAMKMENNLSAPSTGTIKKICVKKGDEVKDGQELVILGE